MRHSEIHTWLRFSGNVITGLKVCTDHTYENEGYSMADQHPAPWKLIASRVVFEHPRLSLLEDTVLLPSGVQTEWLCFKDQRDFVVAICLDTEQRVLVSRQYCHPARRVVHEFPGGFADEGESYIQAARRELREEVGLYPHQLDELGAFLAYPRRSALRGRVFLARELEACLAAPDAEEFIAYEWLTIAAVENRMRSGEIDNAHMIAAWNIFRIHCPAFFS
jgi:ADP-ribose pyrophosphatase